jgi:hypothetical protein
MKQVQGYVCLAEFRTRGNFDIQIIYGRSHGNRVLYGNIEGNDFAVFESKEERDVSSALVKQFISVKNVRPAFLQMKIAGTEEEIATLRDEKSLAVIAFDSSLRFNRLVGPFVEGRPLWEEMPYALMRTTDYAPFTDLEKAKSAAREIERQMRYLTRIAAFDLSFEE